MAHKPEDGHNRIDERLDVLWDATALIEGKEYACTVTNVSTAGALMKLDAPLAEKQQFLLNVPGLNEYAAEVAWVNRPYYGLKLLVGQDLKLKDYAGKVGRKDI